MSALKTAIKKRHTVNLFFTELIIALLFFSISGAVIFRVFVSADKKTRESMKKENAIICAQSIAEVYSETADIDKTFDIVFSDRGVMKSALKTALPQLFKTAPGEQFRAKKCARL